MRIPCYNISKPATDTAMLITLDGDNVSRHYTSHMHTIYGMDFIYLKWNNTSSYPKTFSIGYLNPNDNYGAIIGIGYLQASGATGACMLPCFLPDRALPQIYIDNSNGLSSINTTPNCVVSISPYIKGLMQYNRISNPATGNYYYTYNLSLFDLFNIISMNYLVNTFVRTNANNGNVNPTSSVPVGLIPLNDLTGFTVMNTLQSNSLAYYTSNGGGMFLYVGSKAGSILNYGIRLAKYYGSELVTEIGSMAMPLLAGSSSSSVEIEAKYKCQLTFTYFYVDATDIGIIEVDGVIVKQFTSSDGQMATYSVNLEAGQRVKFYSNSIRKFTVWLREINLLE
ncbi:MULTISPECIES: hypothetical protein [Candidatus Nitrosocaldus]|jgi:hypothetical protein|uniref:Uncharacterized protein n=1 Tax=Candidatus Nitrosocaldus cavascurensis TaxID=2058097 RepID=A0A2K5AQE4_9ARCH|nr:MULTISPECIES: hypothetical protein [Candidatus Nitrosocaldus]SPC33872.1 protein of unknown function [Candidatus Nitrosocaldus cavascurensis]